LRILLVEDDHNLLEAVADVLADEHFDVEKADNGTDGLLLAEQRIYDLLILDIMMPGLDGLSVIRQLRHQGDLTPALFLTAKDSVESKVLGLREGADDYLVKPFAIDELLARIHALLRRSKGFDMKNQTKRSYGRLSIVTHEYEAYCMDNPLKLSTKEFELLAYLIENKEQILQRTQIFNRIWGMNSEANETAVDLYIHYLRKKLMPYGCDHYIQTVRGVGYMLKADDAHV